MINPPIIRLSNRDRLELARLGRSRSRKLAVRAQIVLACADLDASNSGVARSIKVSRPTVIFWRNRFALEGIRSLYSGYIGD